MNRMEGVCVCEDTGDQPSMFRATNPVARKRHECCECGEAIVPGETYERVFGVWWGDAESFTTCLPCATLRKQYCCHFTKVQDTLRETLGMDYVTGEWIGNSLTQERLH